MGEAQGLLDVLLLHLLAEAQPGLQRSDGDGRVGDGGPGMERLRGINGQTGTVGSGGQEQNQILVVVVGGGNITSAVARRRMDSRARGDVYVVASWPLYVSAAAGHEWKANLFLLLAHVDIEANDVLRQRGRHGGNKGLGERHVIACC